MKKKWKKYKICGFFTCFEPINCLFITGNYAQRPKELISENRLFISCLVFEVKQFEAKFSGQPFLDGKVFVPDVTHF